MRRVSRRQAIRLMMVGAIGAGLLQLSTQLEGLRYAPGVLRAKWLQLSGASARVALVRCGSYAEAQRAVHQAWQLADGPAVRGKRVVLKPNLVDALPGRPVHTAPEVLEGAITFLQEAGAAEVVVADGPSFSRDPYDLLTKSGYGAVLARRGIRFVDLNYDDLDEAQVTGNYADRFHSLFLPRTVLRADLVVSLPKLKTHHWTGVSLSMKNLFGVVPGTKYGWPKNSLHTNGIDASILALFATVRPGFALVDGVVGMEGDGPVSGSPRVSGILVAGADLVAVDATATRAMGIDPWLVSHLALGRELGLGLFDEGQIELAGERLADVAQAYAEPPSGLRTAR